MWTKRLEKRQNKPKTEFLQKKRNVYQQNHEDAIPKVVLWRETFLPACLNKFYRDISIPFTYWLQRSQCEKAVSLNVTILVAFGIELENNYTYWSKCRMSYIGSLVRFFSEVEKTVQLSKGLSGLSPMHVFKYEWGFNMYWSKIETRRPC